MFAEGKSMSDAAWKIRKYSRPSSVGWRRLSILYDSHMDSLGFAE
jgi:hypothetical protein